MEESKLYFAIVLLNTGQRVIGQIEGDNYESWKNNQAKLIVKFPKALTVTAVPQGGQIAGYQTTISPIYPEKTKQAEIVIEASFIEILDEIQVEENTMICRHDLFGPYNDAVDQWQHEISGIVKPSVDEIRATKGNVIDFRKK